MERNIAEIFSELGGRMEKMVDEAAKRGEGAPMVVAARNIAREMLSSSRLAPWLDRYPDLPRAVPRNVLVIMAGNIPFVGMHDLLCVLAAGHRAMVKPSSKDSANMSWVVGQLLDIEPRLPVSIVSGDELSPDAVVAMGGDAAVASIAEKYTGLPMLLRGNRSSLAVLSGDESPRELDGLADDIVSYSGLGCRNVSLVFVPCGYDFSHLGQAISKRTDSIEAGYRNDCRQARALLRMGAIPHIDCDAVLLVENRGFPSRPTVLHYAFYDNAGEVSDWIAEHHAEIQCVASNAPLFTDAIPLGTTQKPGPGDYPDGRDTMRFLATI